MMTIKTTPEISNSPLRVGCRIALSHKAKRVHLCMATKEHIRILKIIYHNGMIGGCSAIFLMCINIPIIKCIKVGKNSSRTFNFLRQHFL
jgi:hypothetical protein